MADFLRFFRPKTEPLDGDAEILNSANEILDFANTSYYAKFMEWLDLEAAKPLKVGDHMDMIQSAVRANTLREIRSAMARRVSSARDAVQQIASEE